MSRIRHFITALALLSLASPLAAATEGQLLSADALGTAAAALPGLDDSLARDSQLAAWATRSWRRLSLKPGLM